MVDRAVDRIPKIFASTRYNSVLREESVAFTRAQFRLTGAERKD